MSKVVKTAIGVAAAAAVLAAAWFGFGKKAPEAPKYLTANVDRGTIVQVVGTTGTLTALTTVKVGSQVSGIVATLHADFNDRVRRGQILATLDPTPFEAAVNQTRAQLERARVGALDAQAKYRRQQALYDAGLSSEDQLESARAFYHQAQAQVAELEAALERAETNLRYSVIRAPIDGVVVSRDYDVGQTVAASFQAPTLFTIAEDLTRMQLTCDVDEADIGQVKVGQPVTFNVDTFPEKEFTGRVAQVRLSPKTANNVVTYPVMVDVDNPDLVLLPGMTAEVRIEVARVENALRVPSAALRFRPELLGLKVSREEAPNGGARGNDGGPPRSDSPGRRRDAAVEVYVSSDDPAAPLRPVRLVPGITDGRFIEVKGGPLSGGERVVVGVATAQSGEAGGLAGMTPMGRRPR